MLHLAMVRSPFAHAKIVSIDTEAAKASENVVAVLTGADLGEAQGVCINAWAITTDQVAPTHVPMPSDRVAFAGETVAVVVARTHGRRPRRRRARRRRVRRAAGRARPQEGPPPTRCSPTPTSAPTSPPSGSSTPRRPAPAATSTQAIEKARGDGIVIEREYRQQRLIPAFMEPRSTVVDPTGEQITMWSATQIPHILRFALAATTGVPESKIRVIAPDVGGGFGGKLQQTPEEMITFAVARRLGKPVKYTETRSESLMTAHHGRDQWQKLTLSAEKDGTVTGLKVELTADLGAYVSIVGGGVPVLGAFMFNAIYKFPAYQFNCQTVLTNKTWTDAYRGAGRPEATYAIERLMDELAAEVGVDPLVVREKNWITHEEFPFTTVAGLEYDTGNYEAATEKAKASFGYDELRAEQQRRREAGDRIQLGIGVSTFTEMCGLAPSRVLGSLNYGAGGWEYASVRMLATGKVEITTGTSAHGQGHETAFSQIVADRLGVAFEDVEILHGDTQVSHRGLDTYGSRSLVVGGEALVRAADKVIEKAKPIAAHLLEASVDDIEFSAGRFGVRGTDQGLAMAEIAMAAFTGAQPARRRRAEPRQRRDVRPGQLQLPPRHAPVRDGGRHRDRRRADAQVHLRRRHRHRHQPDDRRGPGARRARPGHRPGAVGGGGVRRLRAPWCPAPSSTTCCPPRPTRSASTCSTTRRPRPPTRSAPRASARPAPSPRPRRSSTPSSTRSGTSAINDIQMPCTPERVWRAIHDVGGSGTTDTEGAAMPHFDESTGMQGTDGPHGRSRRMIPTQFEYLAPDQRRRGPRGARRARRRRQGDRRRAEPAPGAADAAQRPRGRHRPRRHRGAARHPRGR